MNLRKTLYNIIIGGTALCAMTACNGILGDIYDDPSDDAITLTQGQLYIDATDWEKWYYIDFDSLQQLSANKDSIGLAYAQTHFTPYTIPTEETDAVEGDSTGMYTYWFDVFGKGISNNERRGYIHTAQQPEPTNWTIAIHRNNVRTNGCSVLETNYTSLDELPENSVSFTGATFTPDVWTENEVWTDQSQMLQSLIGCQGIKINRVLSSWLKLDIPPMPPRFTMNSHVFIVRLKNGNFLALQLENYMNTAGTKCWLTINYKYPY